MAGVTLPYWIDPGVTAPIVVGGLLLGVVAAGIAGVVPVLRSTSQAVQSTLQQKAGRSGVRFGRLSTVLIVADVAAAVAVIGLAVAVGRQVEKTIANEGTDGITAGRYLSFSLERPTMFDAASTDDGQTALVARMAATQEALVTRLKAEPGVHGVAVGSVLPRMEHPNTRVEVADASARRSRARWAQVDPNFFIELHQPVLAGRGFTAADLSPSANTVIVNTSFVANVLDGRNPIGQRVRFLSDDTAEPAPWLEIIGVVGHLGMRSINADLDTGIYRPLRPGSLQHVRIAVEVGAAPCRSCPACVRSPGTSIPRPSSPRSLR